MQITTSLIVILMFVAVVGIGVGNILMTYAGIVARFKPLRDHQLGAAWLLILLLSYLNMFWNCTALAGRDEWTFLQFLYAISGPILLLFASSLMASLLEGDPGSDSVSGAQAEIVLTRFFWLYGLSHAWFIGIDHLIGLGWTLSTSLSAGLAAASVVLAVAGNIQVRRAFTLLVLLASVADIVLQG